MRQVGRPFPRRCGCCPELCSVWLAGTSTSGAAGFEALPLKVALWGAASKSRWEGSLLTVTLAAALSRLSAFF